MISAGAKVYPVANLNIVPGFCIDSKPSFSREIIKDADLSQLEIILIVPHQNCPSPSLHYPSPSHSADTKKFWLQFMSVKFQTIITV